MEQHEQLRKYNRWRRGDKRLKMPDPKELGELIDGVADRLEVLEREHTLPAEWLSLEDGQLKTVLGGCCEVILYK